MFLVQFGLIVTLRTKEVTNAEPRAKNEKVADKLRSLDRRTNSCIKTNRGVRRSIEIQNASLELNVRDWTPGVEPCAETKSSRHCHLGRDSRFLYPLASLHCIFLFVYRLPLVRLLFSILSSLRTDSRSLVHLVGDRLITNLPPLFGNRSEERTK